MKEYKYSINGNEYSVAIVELEGNTASVEVNGKNYQVEILGEPMPQPAPKSSVKPVAPKPAAAPSSAPAPASEPTPAPSVPASGTAVLSPLPGVILDVKVQVGQQVKAGDTVAILEAMKMENNISAESDGVVTAIKVSKGDSILEGAEIVLIG